MEKEDKKLNKSDSSDDDDDIYNIYNSKSVCNRFKSQLEELKSTFKKNNSKPNVVNKSHKQEEIRPPPKKKPSPEKTIIKENADNEVRKRIVKEAEESDSSSDDSVQSLEEINGEDCDTRRNEPINRKKPACSDVIEIVSEEPPARSTRSKAKSSVASNQTLPRNSPVKKKRGPIDNYFKPVNGVVEILDDDEDDEEQIVELKSDDEKIEEEDEVNFEVGVKIIWKSIFPPRRFTLRKFQKFSTIFEHFMKEEKVPADKIILTLNGQRVKPTDTPDSLNLRAVDFIEGGILSQFSNNFDNSNAEEDADDGSMVSVKFQDNNKKIVKLKLKKTDKMKIVMLKYAEQMEMQMEKIKFLFDGEILDPSETPVTLGLDNEEIIDVKYL